MSLYHINFWNICCMLHIICLKIFLLTSNFHCHSHFFVAALYWYCNDWGFNRTKVTTKYRCNHWRSQPTHLEAHSQAKNLLQARSNGHSGAVFPHIFYTPQMLLWKKNLFQTYHKSKNLTPLQCISPANFKTWVRSWGTKMFDFRRATVFCLGYHHSEHKMTRYSKHFVGSLPLATTMGVITHWVWCLSHCKSKKIIFYR